MQALIWIGAAISVIGLVGIVVSLVTVQRARRANLSDDQLREAVRKALPLNLGAFMLSALGLICVAVGVILS